MSAVQRQPIAPARVTVPGTSITLPVRMSPANPLIPLLDPTYIFRTDLVEEVAFAIEAKQNCMLVGDAGAGKSSLIEQLAALTNNPLRRCNLHGESDTTLFVGRDIPTEVDGVRTLVYKWGILAQAMRDGQWLLLDEIDAALQPVLFVLQSMLEDNGRLLLEDADGTVVHKHPDFRLFATANTVGIASRNKVMYSGTMSRLNEATIDRFGAVVHVGNLAMDDEIRLIMSRVPETDPDFARAIVLVANEIRTALAKDQITTTMSTRKCLQWAHAIRFFHPMRAAKVTIMNKLGAEDAKVVDGVIQRYFGTK